MEQQLQITQNDFIACECGNINLVPLYSVVKVKSPMIGQPPIISLLGVTYLKCLECGKQWNINDSKNIGEMDFKERVIGL